MPAPGCQLKSVGSEGPQILQEVGGGGFKAHTFLQKPPPPPTTTVFECTHYGINMDKGCLWLQLIAIFKDYDKTGQKMTEKSSRWNYVYNCWIRPKANDLIH